MIVPFTKNCSKLLPCGLVMEFLISLLEFRLGITVIISEQVVETFSATAPTEIFWHMEERLKKKPFSWAQRRWASFLEKKAKRNENVNPSL